MVITAELVPKAGRLKGLLCSYYIYLGFLQHSAHWILWQEDIQMTEAMCRVGQISDLWPTQFVPDLAVFYSASKISTSFKSPKA